MINTYMNYRKNDPIIGHSEKFPIEALVCTALEYAGHYLPIGLYANSYDNFGDFIADNESIENYYKELAPVLYSEYRSKMPGHFKPDEVWVVLTHCVNSWVGSNITEIKYNITQEEIDEQLDQGLPVIVSYRESPEEHRLTVLLGKNENGYDVLKISDTDFSKISKEDFNSKVKPIGSKIKNAIFIKPAILVI